MTINEVNTLVTKCVTSEASFQANWHHLASAVINRGVNHSDHVIGLSWNIFKSLDQPVNVKKLSLKIIEQLTIMDPFAARYVAESSLLKKIEELAKRKKENNLRKRKATYFNQDVSNLDVTQCIEAACQMLQSWSTMDETFKEYKKFRKAFQNLAKTGIILSGQLPTLAIPSQQLPTSLNSSSIRDSNNSNIIANDITQNIKPQFEKISQPIRQPSGDLNKGSFLNPEDSLEENISLENKLIEATNAAELLKEMINEVGDFDRKEIIEECAQQCRNLLNTLQNLAASIINNSNYQNSQQVTKVIDIVKGALFEFGEWELAQRIAEKKVKENSLENSSQELTEELILVNMNSISNESATGPTLLNTDVPAQLSPANTDTTIPPSTTQEIQAPTKKHTKGANTKKIKPRKASENFSNGYPNPEEIVKSANSYPPCESLEPTSERALVEDTNTQSPSVFEYVKADKEPFPTYKIREHEQMKSLENKLTNLTNMISQLENQSQRDHSEWKRQIESKDKQMRISEERIKIYETKFLQLESHIKALENKIENQKDENISISSKKSYEPRTSNVTQLPEFKAMALTVPPRKNKIAPIKFTNPSTPSKGSSLHMDNSTKLEGSSPLQKNPAETIKSNKNKLPSHPKKDIIGNIDLENALTEQILSSVDNCEKFTPIELDSKQRNTNDNTSNGLTAPYTQTLKKLYFDEFSWRESNSKYTEMTGNNILKDKKCLKFFKKMLIRNDSVLYEDESIQIGIKANFSGCKGKMFLFIGNKQSTILQNVETTFFLPDENCLKISASCIPQQLNAHEQVYQKIQINCETPFEEYPIFRLEFVLADGSSFKKELYLPISINKFVAAIPIDKILFFDYWNDPLYTMKTHVSVIKLSPKDKVSVSEIALLSQLGGALYLCDAFDDSPKSIVLFGIFTCQHSQKGSLLYNVLVRIELGDGQNQGKLQIVIRSNSEVMAVAIINIFNILMGDEGT